MTIVRKSGMFQLGAWMIIPVYVFDDHCLFINDKFVDLMTITKCLIITEEVSEELVEISVVAASMNGTTPIKTPVPKPPSPFERKETLMASMAESVPEPVLSGESDNRCSTAV